jgi:hypothetical protein
MNDPVSEIAISPVGIPGWKPGQKPELVYHYTNTSGLMGILNSKSLWATDVWYMNDTGEGTYATEMIRQFLDARTSPSEAMREFCSLAKEIIKTPWDSRGIRSYIACLSENGDQLSQWRSYGYGRGFSIAFDLESLLGLFGLPPSQGLLGRVVYDPQLQQRLLADVYQKSEQLLSEPQKKSDDQSDPQHPAPTEALTKFMIRSLTSSSFFKHPAFSEEAEIRIYTARWPGYKKLSEVKFRESTLGIIPYVSIPLIAPDAEYISAIREVIIGPQPHQREVQRATGQFFAANGLSDVEIRLSEVPLRA